MNTTHDSPTDTPISEIVPAGSLLASAKHHGIDPSPRSPLTTLAQFANAGRPAAIFDVEPGPEALRTLGAATRRIDMTLSSGGAGTSMAFHGHDDAWVGLWPEAEGLRVCGPMGSAGVGAFAAMFFRASTRPAPWGALRLNHVETLALCAVVDALRTEHLQAWLRHEASTGTVTEEAIDAAIRSGVSANDGRWFVTLLNDLEPIAPNPKVVHDGLERLTGRGLVERNGTVLTASRELRALTDDTWFNEPSMIVEVGSSSTAARLLIIRGASTAWCLSSRDAHASASSEWTLDGVDDLGVADVLAELISGVVSSAA